MKGRNHLVVASCIIAISLGMLMLSWPEEALGQMTIPTRTPTPDSGSTEQPTPKPTSENGGGNNQPQPTDEPVPTETPFPTATTTGIIVTDTPQLDASETPIFGSPTIIPNNEIPDPPTETPIASPTADYSLSGVEIVVFPPASLPFPEAGSCGTPPTFTATNTAIVNRGPSKDYPLAGLLAEGEVRPLTGRAAFSNWWVIQLDGSGRMGWVNDESGVIKGFTGRVPIISAPALDGLVPTPGGDAWVPTPSPGCDAPELLAGAALDTDTAEEISPPSGEPDHLPEVKIGDAEPVTANLADENTAELKALLAESNRGTDPTISDLAATAEPLELGPANTLQIPNFIPVAGIVLILGAIFVWIFAGRTRSTGSSDS